MIGHNCSRAFRHYSSTRVTTLANGVRVATQPTKDRCATVGVYIDAGSRDESVESFGVNSILQQIAHEANVTLGAFGSRIETNVGREQTTYQAKIHPENLSATVAELGKLARGDDCVTRFDFAKECALNSTEDDRPIKEVLRDRLHRNCFRDGPLGFSLCGPHEKLASLEASSAQNFVQEHYTADRIVLAAAGPVDHDELVLLAKEALQMQAKPTRSIMQTPYFCGSDVIYRNDEMGPIAYFTLGWQTVPYKHPDAVVFMVMQSIIGSYKRDSSKTVLPGVLSGNRTVNRVANKMNVGCAEEFEAGNCFYRDTGLFTVFGECDEIAVENCVGEMQFGVNMLSGGVTDEEVARAKRDLRVKLFSGLTGTSRLAENMGLQLLSYDRTISPQEFNSRLQFIDAEEVRRVAYKYLHDSEIAAVSLGPLHGMPPQIVLRRDNMMQRY